MFHHVVVERFDRAAAGAREQGRHEAVDCAGQSRANQAKGETERHLLVLAIGLADTLGMIEEEFFEHGRESRIPSRS